MGHPHGRLITFVTEVRTEHDLRPSGFFVLRTPLLPLAEFRRWTDSDDKEERLRQIGLRPEVQEALFLASPSLLDALVEPGGERARKAMPSVVSYFARMCSRATPFGLFAGCGVGRLGSTTRLEVPGPGELRRHTRLDMGYITELASEIERRSEVRHFVRWRPNTSIYSAGGRLRYVEARMAGRLRSYHLVAVDESAALRATLEHATDGATTADLAQRLALEVSPTEAEDFIAELVDAQLLVSDLQPSLTGNEALSPLIATLSEHSESSAVARSLEQVRDALTAIDDAGLGRPAGDYHRVRALLEPLTVPTELSRLFQVDVMKPAAGASLGPRPLAALSLAIEVLHRLAPAARRDDLLARFCHRFTERYQDRRVPLLVALDEDIGVGFGVDSADGGSPLLAGFELSPFEHDGERRFTPRDEFLLAKLHDALRSGEEAIVLGEADIKNLESRGRPPLPDAVEVYAALAAPSSEAVDRGEFQVFVLGISGAPGACLLGRFCHDDELCRHVQAHLRAEEASQPDAIFAEVVHLPEGRLGNVLCRPVLRSHELPYLGRSGAPKSAQLSVSDLLVSVRDGRVHLSDRRSGRDVVPRLTTAHDFTNGVGVYHFLCSLQRQGTAELGWSWGALSRAPFLPRVVYGQLVLARSQWRLQASELPELPAMRRADRLPRYVALVDGEQELLTDLDDALSTDALRRHVAVRGEAMLVEQFPGADDLCAVGPQGKFVHELIVPFVRTSTPRPSRAAAPVRTRSVRRSFAPGSDWLYVKMYTGVATTDRLLVDVVKPLVSESLRLGLAESWFFVRYGDPQWHVRLRLHGGASSILPLLQEVAASSLDDGRITRLQLDTYEREIERYGGDAGIEISERIFHYDSEAVLHLLRAFGRDGDLDLRWRLALLGIDRLLSDFGLDLAAQVEWAKEQRRTFGIEFGVDGRVGQHVGQLYRRLRPMLDHLTNADGDGDNPMSEAVDIFRRRSDLIRPEVECLRRLHLDVRDMAGHFVHMHANRLLRSHHRAQELVLYNLLYRIYTAQLARSRS